MREEVYRGCNIRSQPHALAGEEEGKYGVNGTIVLDYGDKIIHVMTEKLNVPDNEWIHKTEEEADTVFIKYAKEYLDKNLKS